MIGSLIKEYLSNNGIKQAFLVEKTGLSASQVSDICIHDRRIDVIEYYRICKALNVPLEFFLSEADKRGGI